MDNQIEFEAFHGLPGYSLYSSSKMALTALYQSLKKELHQKGVFVGIAYVGFTQNDTEKVTFAPNGSLEKVPERNKYKVATKEKTAHLIIKQIINAKGLKVHSLIGKTAFVMSRLFPSLLHRIYFNNFYKANHSNQISDQAKLSAWDWKCRIDLRVGAKKFNNIGIREQYPPHPYYEDLLIS